MKYIFSVLALLFSFCLQAQIKISELTPYTNRSLAGVVVPIVVGGVTQKVDASYFAYNKIDSAVMGHDTLFFLKNGAVAFFKVIPNAGADLSGYIQKQSQSPTAAISGGETRELMSNGASLSYTLNWTAGRATATTLSLATSNIVSVTINGVSQSFSNPSVGASVSGTYTASVARNTNTTFAITVTTSDGKSATASTAVLFQPQRYWFYSTSATPTGSNVLAVLGGGSELSTSSAKSNFTVTTSGGNQYISYAYPANEGALSSINIGGFESIVSFTQRTVSVTNASGYAQNYFVYTSNNQLPTTTISNIQ